MNEELIRRITEEVLRQIEQTGGCGCLTEDGDRKLLAVGCPRSVPEELQKNYRVCDLADYAECRDVMRYERIVITDLSRILLRGGIPVTLPALSWRAF